jgi:hypothetical protein
MDNMKWQKSSRSTSNGGACVEIGRALGSKRIAARDSKDRGGPQLRFAAEKWREFLNGVKDGRFDL